MKKDKSDRDKVCDKYEQWLNLQIEAKDKKIINALNKIREKHKKYRRVRLFCWCHPERCHAKSIRKWLYNQIYLKGNKKEKNKWKS